MQYLIAAILMFTHIKASMCIYFGQTEAPCFSYMEPFLIVYIIQKSEEDFTTNKSYFKILLKMSKYISYDHTMHVLHFHTHRKKNLNKKFQNIYKMSVYSVAKLSAIIIYYE